MSEVWNTKDGPRRVRRDPPTLEDAVLAAQGLTDDVDSQVEIVTSLMQVSTEAARHVIRKMAHHKEPDQVTVAGRGGVSRAVVVERRPSRRAAMPPRASAGYRGRE